MCVSRSSTTGIFIVCANLALYMGNIVAGRSTHLAMLKNVLMLPMDFYDTVPIGQILNRFSKDLDVLDTAIQKSLGVLILTTCFMLSVPVGIGYSSPEILIALVPVVVVYLVIQVR